MSASLRSAAPLNDESTNQPASVSWTPPSGTAVDDIVIFGLAQASGANPLNPATGWAPLTNVVTNGSNLSSRLFAKKMVSADLSVAHIFDAGGGARTVAGYQVIKDADLLSEIVVATPTVGTTGDPFSTPTVATAEADCFIAEWVFARSALATKLTLAPVSGLVEDMECNTLNTASAVNLACAAYHTTANSGAVGTYGGQQVDAGQAITNSQRYTLAVTSKSADTADVGLQIRVIKTDGSLITVNLYAVKSDGTLQQVSDPF